MRRIKIMSNRKKLMKTRNKNRRQLKRAFNLQLLLPEVGSLCSQSILLKLKIFSSQLRKKNKRRFKRRN